MSYEMNSTQPNTGYGGGSTAYRGYHQDVEAQQHLVNPAGQAGSLDFHTFLGQVSNIQGSIAQLSTNVSRIASLHNLTISSYDTGSASSATVTAQLESLVAETSLLNNHLRDDIKFLERDSKYPGDPQGPQKKQQVDVLKKSFDAELKNYQLMESQYRGQYRTQMERQYRIVKPDATAEEIEQAVTSGETQVFSQAIMSSARSSNAQSTLGAVKARHAEIQRIEQTLVELVQLFEEMAREVEAAEPIVEKIENQTIYAHEELVKGNGELVVARKHAWNTRRNKWICLGICVVILIIIVGSVAGSIVAKNKKNDNPPA